MKPSSLSASIGVLLIAVVAPLAWLRYTSGSKHWSLLQDQAMLLDRSISAHSGGRCRHPLQGATVEGQGRVIPVGTSFNLVVGLYNVSEDDCEVKVAVHATTFDISPAAAQQLTLPPGESVQVRWNLTPKAVAEGMQTLAVQAELDSSEVGIAVTSASGLTPTQSGILSWVASVFGPMLTVPCWITFFQERKNRKTEKETEIQKKREGDKEI